jgi:hypothetical protein
MPTVVSAFGVLVMIHINVAGQTLFKENDQCWN